MTSNGLAQLGPPLDVQHPCIVRGSAARFRAVCNCASSPSPSRARPTTNCSRSRKEPNVSASTRSSVPITTSASARASPGPGSTDAWMTLAAIARETDSHPARHARHPGDLPVPGPARDPGRASRRDERRPRRARAGRGLVRRRARGVRDPVPVDRRSLRDARGTARDRHRALEHTRRRDVLVRREAPFASSTRPRCRSRCNGPGRRSSWAVGAPSARLGSRRATRPSSTCRSRRSRTSAKAATTCAPRATRSDAIPRR